MKVADLKSLVCSNNHTFDLAKQGYVNTLTRPVKSNYDRDLFKARHETIMTSQLYHPFHQIVSEIVDEHLADNKRNNYILDAGAGEGSHLAKISEQTINEFIGIGIDLAKEGIRLAASNYQAIWLVADLANIPIKNDSFQVILNILSPANYQEFNRILANDGLIIKVVPGSNYLKELREFLFHQEEKETYTNDKTISLFKENFPMVQIRNVTYTKEFNQNALKHLIQMTPLAWNVDVERVMKTLDKEQIPMTIDLDLLIGKNK